MIGRSVAEELELTSRPQCELRRVQETMAVALEFPYRLFSSFNQTYPLLPEELLYTLACSEFSVSIHKKAVGLLQQPKTAHGIVRFI